jgi:hypothetical protein
MSRYDDYDYDGDYAALDAGRWERNSRAALKSKRGRKALAEIREALLALPEKRLIEGAVCTVGGPERVPEVTEEEIGKYPSLGSRASWLREDRALREELRRQVAGSVERQGPGVCVNGALLWHRKVKAGMSPGEAFAALPTVIAYDDGDPMNQTARLAEREAGVAFTLAWELAYRNDETYRGKTPEERYAAFLAWIDAELAA